MPLPSMKKFEFPRNLAFIDKPDRPYKTLGIVKSKVTWPSLDPIHEEKDLCRNYFNKGVTDLIKHSKQNGGEGVADIKSVVFLMDGKTEYYKTPECSDDGEEGQVLLQGIAFRFKKFEEMTAEEKSEFKKTSK